MFVRENRLAGGSSSSFRSEMRRPEASRMCNGMTREARGPPWTRGSDTVRGEVGGSERGERDATVG